MAGFDPSTEDESGRAALSWQLVNMCPGCLAGRHSARAGLAITNWMVSANVEPAKIEHFAPSTSGERQYADRGDLLGPASLAGFKGTAQPRQLVSVSRNRATWFLGFLRMPRHGLLSCSRQPHSSARNIITITNRNQ